MCGGRGSASPSFRRRDSPRPGLEASSADELAVTAYLSQARTQLALAVEMTGPAAVAALKAEIATAAEATKQLGLSKEIQQDAQEMVRRAEYALGKAIRAGQESGEVRARGERVERNNQHGQVAVPVDNRNSKVSPYDFAKPDELHGNGDNNIYAMADGVSHEQFEEALTDARDEGNLSRANVVRKVQGVKSDKLAPADRLNKIGDMADAGHTSDQIAKAVGASEKWVRRLAEPMTSRPVGSGVLPVLGLSFAYGRSEARSTSYEHLPSAPA